MAADDGRLAQRSDERVVHVVDLDRAQAEPFEPGRLPYGPHERREVVAGRAVAEASEVDAREHDLAVTLRDAPAYLAQHRLGGPAARRAAHERDHAEVARERAAVLDLHEGTHALDARVGLHAADRTDVAGDERRRLLARLRDHRHVRRQSRERVAAEIRAAAGEVDAGM